MNGEQSVVQVWAALLGLCLLSACAVTAGIWLCIYHEEARILEPFVEQRCTTMQLILDDLPFITP